MPVVDPDNRARARRLAEILDALKAQGFPQSRVASELRVTPNYLSDLRHNQRVITEPTARTVASACGVSFTWLWTGEGPRPAPAFRAAGGSPGERPALPILSEPCTGEPRAAPGWDGSLIALAGRAAAAASLAVSPYVLRLPHADKTGRLAQGDLILVNQDRSASGTLAVVETADGNLRLARRQGRGWRAVESGRAISGPAQVVGFAVGIVWAAL